MNTFADANPIVMTSIAAALEALMQANVEANRVNSEGCTVLDNMQIALDHVQNAIGAYYEEN